MARITKRISAKRDVIQQWIWYAENGGVDLAESFRAALESTARLLAESPECGVRVSTTKSDLQGIRRFPVGNGFEKNLIFYFPRPYGVELVRVVWGNRNLETFLG
jgi:plasmid stabilization system protein ParE